MKNIALVFIIAILLASTVMITACENIDIKEYPEINNTYQFAIDGSIPLSNINNAVDINQSRGFRGENYIRLGTDEAFPDSGENYLERLKNQLELYDEDGIKLMQVYEYLTQNNMPFNPNLLTDGKISIYDYLKYHLGYQLVASNLKIEGNKASFMITNFGFSAPHNYTMRVYVDGKQVNTYEEFNALDLKQFGQKIYTFDYTRGDIQVEFVNKRDSSDTIKLFNDIQYQSGKNLIFDSGL